MLNFFFLNVVITGQKIKKQLTFSLAISATRPDSYWSRLFEI